MPDQKRCFVISPIGDPDSDIRAEADWVLYQMIKPTLEPEFEVTRADAFAKIHVISNEVINSIRKADLIVADMTGHNANVFYELAIAHAYHRAVVPLIREGERIPFDTAPMGTIIYSRARYEKWEAAKRELKRAADAAMKSGYTVSNPITMAIGHEQASQSGDSLAKIVAAQGEAIAVLKKAVIENTIASMAGKLSVTADENQIFLANRFRDLQRKSEALREAIKQSDPDANN